MEKVQRTAAQLAAAEKFFNELKSESKEIHATGMLPESFLNREDALIEAEYKGYVAGEKSEAVDQFEQHLEKWVAAGSPTPSLDGEQAETATA